MYFLYILIQMFFMPFYAFFVIFVLFLFDIVFVIMQKMETCNILLQQFHSLQGPTPHSHYQLLLNKLQHQRAQHTRKLQQLRQHITHDHPSNTIHSNSNISEDSKDLFKNSKSISKDSNSIYNSGYKNTSNSVFKDTSGISNSKLVDKDTTRLQNSKCLLGSNSRFHNTLACLSSNTKRGFSVRTSRVTSKLAKSRIDRGDRSVDEYCIQRKQLLIDIDQLRKQVVWLRQKKAQLDEQLRVMTPTSQHSTDLQYSTRTHTLHAHQHLRMLAQVCNTEQAHQQQVTMRLRKAKQLLKAQIHQLAKRRQAADAMRQRWRQSKQKAKTAINQQRKIDLGQARMILRCFWLLIRLDMAVKTEKHIEIKKLIDLEDQEKTRCKEEKQSRTIWQLLDVFHNRKIFLDGRMTSKIIQLHSTLQTQLSRNEAAQTQVLQQLTSQQANWQQLIQKLQEMARSKQQLNQQALRQLQANNNTINQSFMNNCSIIQIFNYRLYQTVRKMHMIRQTTNQIMLKRQQTQQLQLFTQQCRAFEQFSMYLLRNPTHNKILNIKDVQFYQKHLKNNHLLLFYYANNNYSQEPIDCLETVSNLAMRKSQYFAMQFKKQLLQHFTTIKHHYNSLLNSNNYNSLLNNNKLNKKSASELKFNQNQTKFNNQSQTCTPTNKQAQNTVLCYKEQQFFTAQGQFCMQSKDYFRRDNYKLLQRIQKEEMRKRGLMVQFPINLHDDELIDTQPTTTANNSQLVSRGPLVNTLKTLNNCKSQPGRTFHKQLSKDKPQYILNISKPSAVKQQLNSLASCISDLRSRSTTKLQHLLSRSTTKHQHLLSKSTSQILNNTCNQRNQLLSNSNDVNQGGNSLLNSSSGHCYSNGLVSPLERMARLSQPRKKAKQLKWSNTQSVRQLNRSNNQSFKQLN